MNQTGAVRILAMCSRFLRTSQGSRILLELHHTKQLRCCSLLQVAGRVSIVSFDHHGREWYCVTPSNFSLILIGVVLKPDSQAVFKVSLVAMSERGEFGESGSSLFRFCFA